MRLVRRAFGAAVTALIAASMAACTGSAPPDTCVTDCADACSGDACQTLDGFDTPDVLDVSDATDVTDAFDASDTVDVVRDTGTDVAIDSAPDVFSVDGSACVSPSPDAGSCNSDLINTLPLNGSACGMLIGPTHFNSTTCQPDTNGPDAVFHTSVTTRIGLAIAVHSALDTVLTVRTDCTTAASGEIACNDVQPGISSALRLVLDPGEYNVVVDQFGMAATGGTYVIETQSFMPAANATCATANAIAAPGTLNDEHIASGDSRSTRCRTIDTGAERFYATTIPVGQLLQAQVTPSGAWRPAVHIFENCTAGASCFADAAAAGTTAVSASWRNTGTAPLDVIIAVAAASEPVIDTDTYSLALTLSP